MNTLSKHSLIHRLPPHRGAILPLIAVMLPVLIIFLGFSVDLAFMQNTRLELRAATDVAARAGAIELAHTEDIGLARAAALRMANLNTVAGKNLTLRDSDVEFGRSEPDNKGKWVFHEGMRPWNSVRVHGDRTAKSIDGPIGLFFNSIYGGNDFEQRVTAVSTFLNVDVCLVLDESGSMKGHKIEELKTAANVFLDELDRTEADEQVALASYSSRSNLDHKLTTNYRAIREEIDDLVADGTTAIGLGLKDGIDGVTGTGRRRLSTPIIVLMTDGQHNTGVEPIVPARDASAQGITVHTITFGYGADIKRMRDVAQETGGRHYHASTGSELTEIFREIARSLPTQLTE